MQVAFLAVMPCFETKLPPLFPPCFAKATVSPSETPVSLTTSSFLHIFFHILDFSMKFFIISLDLCMKISNYGNHFIISSLECVADCFFIPLLPFCISLFLGPHAHFFPRCFFSRFITSLFLEVKKVTCLFSLEKNRVLCFLYVIMLLCYIVSLISHCVFFGLKFSPI